MKLNVIMLTVLLLSFGYADVSARAPDGEKVYWGRAVNGVQAGLSLEGAQTTFLQGQHVALRLVLRNVTKKTISFEAEGYADASLNWNVVTEEGSHKILIGRMLNVNGRYPDPLTITLMTGETWTLTGQASKLLLAGMGNTAYAEPVAFVHSGSYVLQVTPLMQRPDGKDNWVRKVVTGAVPLKVLANPGNTAVPGK